jgi:hypothetical protein
MTTVWVYVDTSKQVGDKDHIKVFASADAADRKSRALRPAAPFAASRRRSLPVVVASSCPRQTELSCRAGLP